MNRRQWRYALGVLCLSATLAGGLALAGAPVLAVQAFVLALGGGVVVWIAEGPQ